MNVLSLFGQSEPFTIEQRMAFDSKGRPCELRVAATVSDERMELQDRIRAALPRVLEFLQTRITDTPVHFTADGKWWTVEALRIDTAGLYRSLLQGESQDVSRALGEVIRETATLPMQNFSSLDARMPFNEIIWHMDALAEGQLALPSALLSHFFERGGGKAYERSKAALMHFAPLLERIQDPNAIWHLADLREDEEVTFQEAHESGLFLPTSQHRGVWRATEKSLHSEGGHAFPILDDKEVLRRGLRRVSIY